MGRLDKRVSKSNYASLKEKSSETHNNLESNVQIGIQLVKNGDGNGNETAKFVFEVFMSAHEGCSGLINIDSGANRLILRLTKTQNCNCQLQINQAD